MATRTLTLTPSMINLNRCFYWAVLLITAASCQKEAALEQSRLMTFKDHNRQYNLTYNGNQVSEIHVTAGPGAPFMIASYSYQTNYIKASLHPSTGYEYVEYFMRKGVLPLSILKHRRINGIDSVTSRTDFYYSQEKDVPDSVILKTQTKLKFIPVYSGGNISDYYLGIDNKPPVLSGSFLYYTTTNVFKTTNPLLFVYSSPVFEFETFLMPRIFSQNTMKKFNGGSFNYDTDVKGNLAVEDYGPSVYPYKRIYIYK